MGSRHIIANKPGEREVDGEDETVLAPTEAQVNYCLPNTWAAQVLITATVDSSRQRGISPTVGRPTPTRHILALESFPVDYTITIEEHRSHHRKSSAPPTLK